MDSEFDTSLFDADPGVFEINTNMLIEEWARQGRLVRQAGRILAKARRRVAKLKRIQGLLDAEIRLQVMQDPTKFGVAKAPEHVVDAIILTNDKYKELMVKIENASYVVDNMENALVALIDKRKGLENAVVLHGQEYFPDCRAPQQPVDMSGLYGYTPGENYMPGLPIVKKKK